MNVELIAYTQASRTFKNKMSDEIRDYICMNKAVALTAVRTCYSHLKPTDIITVEGDKYFGQRATDGLEGDEADRLIRHIMKSKHTSTLEHLNYTFAIEGVSRSLLAQLTRHRHMSFSVQSQRYVKMGSEDKSGGFDYVTPTSIKKGIAEENTLIDGETIENLYEAYMSDVQGIYDTLRKAGVSAEDARMVLPNAATCNMVMTCNLRTLLEFYSKRKPGSGAQWEIANLAETLKEKTLEVDEWLEPFFG